MHDQNTAREAAASLLAQLREVSPPPVDYGLVAATAARHNRARATLARYQGPESRGIQLGAAHYSILASRDRPELLGFTNLTPRTAALGPASNACAQASAAAFLARFAPDLAQSLETLWVATHAERAGGMDIVGTKVKMVSSESGLYSWVVVAGDGEVVTFERDVVWNDDMSRRETQQWLHDSWLTTQLGDIG